MRSNTVQKLFRSSAGISLLVAYNAKEEKTLEDILDFHVKFERIHPFQDDDVM